jgi:hypothetical protein
MKRYTGNFLPGWRVERAARKQLKLNTMINTRQEDKYEYG